MTPKRALLLILLLEVSIIVISVLWDGVTLEALHTTTRFSGRLSLLIFSVIFLFHQRPETLRTWLSEKFYLMFAIAHGIHLIELLSYLSLSGKQPILIRLAGGFVAYLFIFLMPLLFERYQAKKIPEPSFRILQNVYQYYLWLIFFLTYLPRILGQLPDVGGHYWEFVLFFCWVIFMMVIKISGFFRLSPARNP